VLGLGLRLRLGLVVGLRLGLIIPTCRANLVLRVIWQCDIFGTTPELAYTSGAVSCMGAECATHDCAAKSDGDDLGEDAEVDLEPLGRRLVAGAPGEPVGQVEAGVSLGACAVPRGRVDGRRRQLAVVDRARHHAQRLRLLAPRCVSVRHITQPLYDVTHIAVRLSVCHAIINSIITSCTFTGVFILLACTVLAVYKLTASREQRDT